MGRVLSKGLSARVVAGYVDEVLDRDFFIGGGSDARSLRPVFLIQSALMSNIDLAAGVLVTDGLPSCTNNTIAWAHSHDEDHYGPGFEAQG
ncbi:hypothetical protein L1987_43535 [Smallanthus sonchifolius]|uniref:Uncharacterized protein n=1 Tax=Smallanthus sonchifolius TaxID=185202 RepID=A0ACB9GN49_9ASTR|nr:hypothetical protein L1987_43535 [Smallanthus sonchifolius]